MGSSGCSVPLAAAYSARVLMLSSARGSGSSTRRASMLRSGSGAGSAGRARRGARAARGCAARRSRTAAPAGRRGSSDRRWRCRAASRAAIRCVRVSRIEERQVARQHQPGGFRVARLRGEDAGDGADLLERILDLRKARAHRIGRLVAPHRDVGARHAAASAAPSRARAACALRSAARPCPRPCACCDRRRAPGHRAGRPSA